jgi:hypothetical protein
LFWKKEGEGMEEIQGFIIVCLLLAFAVTMRAAAPESASPVFIASDMNEHVLRTYLPGDEFTVADETHGKRNCFLFLSYHRIPHDPRIEVDAIDPSYRQTHVELDGRYADIVVFNGCMRF